MTAKQWENAYRRKVEDHDELRKENAALRAALGQVWQKLASLGLVDIVPPWTQRAVADTVEQSRKEAQP